MSQPGVTSVAFRQAMSCFATGVTVVTTISDGRPYGLTVSAFCSVSLDPLLVLVSLQQSSQTLALIQQSGCFAVNVLAAQQQPLAQRFARKDRLSRSFGDIPHHRGVLDVALFDEALARLECLVAGIYPGGDHILLLGKVSAVEWNDDMQASQPLLFYRSTFRGVQPEPLSPV
ncbi:MAG TPA: flavin reductase family protein [Dehalococcoidia bacterium]|nr:flavin reductase family protein [Dehalococcoidia bacterium]